MSKILSENTIRNIVESVVKKIFENSQDDYLFTSALNALETNNLEDAEISISKSGRYGKLSVYPLFDENNPNIKITIIFKIKFIVDKPSYDNPGFVDVESIIPFELNIEENGSNKKYTINFKSPEYNIVSNTIDKWREDIIDVFYEKVDLNDEPDSDYAYDNWHNK